MDTPQAGGSGSTLETNTDIIEEVNATGMVDHAQVCPR